MQGTEYMFLGLAVLSVLFVLWPLRTLVFTKTASELEVVDRQGENLALYEDHLRELELSKDEGRIEESQYLSLKQELDRNLLEEVPVESTSASSPGLIRKYMIALFITVAVLVPLSSYFLYQHLGASDIINVAALEQEMQRLGEAVVSADQAGSENAGELRRQLAVVQAEYIDELRSYLERNPEDIQNWYLLARSFMAMSDFSGAAGAYRQILQVEPNDTQIMAELAQAQFLANGNHMNPGIEDLALRVIKVDGSNSTALGLAGIAAFEGQRYQDAIRYWGRAVMLMGPETGGAMALSAGIKRAKELLAAAGGPSVADGADSGPDAMGADETQDQASIKLQVDLAAAVNAKPTDTVFIYARAWNGPKMPLAIKRITVKDLPASIELNESMAMMPSMTIKSFPELELVARISEDGSPTSKPGDWQASVGPVKLSEITGPVQLNISSQVQ